MKLFLLYKKPRNEYDMQIATNPAILKYVQFYPKTYMYETSTLVRFLFKDTILCLNLYKSGQPLPFSTQNKVFFRTANKLNILDIVLLFATKYSLG